MQKSRQFCHLPPVVARRTARVLLADFWYFSSQKSTIKEKLLYDTYLSEFFSLVRKERKGQKEECFPLLNTFCRLAATSTNKVPRPSRYSLVTATRSKRLSADSDLLLCHVRLWRTSRFKFGCVSWCEHSKIKFALHNTHVTPHPPLSRSPLLPQSRRRRPRLLRESVNSPLEKARSYSRQRTNFPTPAPEIQPRGSP